MGTMLKINQAEQCTNEFVTTFELLLHFLGQVWSNLETSFEYVFSMRTAGMILPAVLCIKE